MMSFGKCVFGEEIVTKNHWRIKKLLWFEDTVTFCSGAHKTFNGDLGPVKREVVKLEALYFFPVILLASKQFNIN